MCRSRDVIMVANRQRLETTVNHATMWAVFGNSDLCALLSSLVCDEMVNLSALRLVRKWHDDDGCMTMTFPVKWVVQVTQLQLWVLLQSGVRPVDVRLHSHPLGAIEWHSITDPCTSRLWGAKTCCALHIFRKTINSSACVHYDVFHLFIERCRPFCSTFVY